MATDLLRWVWRMGVGGTPGRSYLLRPPKPLRRWRPDSGSHSMRSRLVRQLSYGDPRPPH